MEGETGSARALVVYVVAQERLDLYGRCTTCRMWTFPGSLVFQGVIGGPETLCLDCQRMLSMAAPAPGADDTGEARPAVVGLVLALHRAFFG
jgi:hypothetical protein